LTFLGESNDYCYGHSFYGNFGFWIRNITHSFTVLLHSKATSVRARIFLFDHCQAPSVAIRECFSRDIFPAIAKKIFHEAMEHIEHE